VIEFQGIKKVITWNIGDSKTIEGVDTRNWKNESKVFPLVENNSVVYISQFVSDTQKGVDQPMDLIHAGNSKENCNVGWRSVVMSAGRLQTFHVLASSKKKDVRVLEGVFSSSSNLDVLVVCKEPSDFYKGCEYNRWHFLMQHFHVTNLMPEFFKYGIEPKPAPKTDALLMDGYYYILKYADNKKGVSKKLNKTPFNPELFSQKGMDIEAANNKRKQADDNAD
jgi:hypothetical protein